jgi:transcriptional regulator, propionate catabolism operon regulatory protein
MIALYKFNKPLEVQLSSLLREFGQKPAFFYSVKSLLDQMMKPMVVITPASWAKELESLPIPVLPVSIHLADLEREIGLCSGCRDAIRKAVIVASAEEISRLEEEYRISRKVEEGLPYSLDFLTQDQLVKLESDLHEMYFMPAWGRMLSWDQRWEKKIRLVSPSLSYLFSVVQHACSLISFTEKAIQERYQLEAIVHSSHDGVIAVDKQGNITLVNHHAKKMLGLPEEVLGRKITDFIPHSDMVRVLKTGKKEIGDLAVLQDKQIVINRFPIIINGTVVGAVSNFKQITDIQKMEMKLRKMLHESGLEARYRISDIVGSSQEIQFAKEQAVLFAETEATVLITGESGTGKEMFAQGIHLASARSLGPFVAVNCAALPESLLESELFGYEEGSFTGARKGGKAGLFELAHGGTLFLDEIGEMPLRIQAILLRVLQEKKVRRVGGERVIPVDVRIIAATNRDLEEEIEQQRFRSDLYYRINVLTLDLPPLRERIGDIPDLVRSIVSQLNEQREKKIDKISTDIFSLLMDYHWPGNIRELRNVIERMVLLEKGSELTMRSAAFFVQKIQKNRFHRIRENELSMKEVEREMIRRALEKYQNNKTKAAQSLGMDRSTLWRKIKEYNL